MGLVLSTAHRRFILIELAIGSALGSLPPALAMYLTVGPFPMPLWGAAGFALFLLKNAFAMGTVMTLLMTLVVRMRVSKGGAPRLERGHAGPFRRMPRSILVRAPLFGAMAAALPGLLGVAVVAVSGLSTMDRLTFALAMGVESLFIAWLLTPAILIGAMSDVPPLAGPETAQ